MATVEFRHCSKRFDDGTQALNDISLSVEEGELMVLVGPSGCGKSTCLRLLAGLDKPSSGDILINNASIVHLPPQQRNIAMVFQNYALYPHMSVYDNLAFPLKMARLSKAEIHKSVMEAAATLELRELLQRKPQQLSGGQRQRVAMGRAIVRHPSVFLMDEPLSNLDANLRVQIRAEIAALQQRLGITMLYVTHDQTEALTLGHRVAVMQAGSIQQVAGPDNLYQQPCNTAVAKFIGNPGMNIFSATIVQQAGQPCLMLNGKELALPARYHSLSHGDGSKVLLGIRAEHLQIGNGINSLNATIVNVESLGHEKIVYFRADWTHNQLLTMRCANFNDAVDKNIHVQLDLEHLHVFDEQGNRLPENI